MKALKKLLLGGMMGLAALQGSASTFVGERSDFRDETIYFAMTTRFYDGDHTNNVCGWDHQDVQIANGDPDWRGDFKGLIDKLDYIKALGFTAIWITPIVQNASGTDFHGYHAMDFTKVDLRYESRTEWGATEDVTFQSLIDAAHAKGMKIVLDIVLNHTGNFGESTLNPLFTRSEEIRNQATASTALIPNPDRLSNGYFDQDPKVQYEERFKYFKNPQYDTHNYYHHYGTGWNWDLPNRWWGQIAGDCVDLNTENDAVAEYLVKCYGEFIKMGVDGFRIDTTGHISRLTFNKQFIPQFIALGEQYKSKRLNGCPFYMFGECCARFGSVIYRDQHNLSSHFYTWKSPESLLSQWNGSQDYWDTQNLPEGHDSPVGPMALCEKETAFDENSDNVFMKNGAWHEPDYSKASGYNVIDFPMHYNFNSAAQAVGIARQGDHYYNDASFNVVYVDSHDYCPGPNDGTRFNGGTAQWAENLALMFTFRGIPCIYYGSEVEFKKGQKVDAGGTANPVKDSGRAYFGEYLEGNVSTTDFGQYTASGNVATTLDGDLAQHVRRLNQIRAAVPALRKGQYTFDDCSAKGGHAFKRAYKDSYALVALNGGATFSNVPAGTYTDIVTGQTYQGGGSITVDAPSTQGQVRVLVKDWKGGKVGEDGKFIYASSPVDHGGNPTFADKPLSRSEFYTADDAVKDPTVTFSPNGGAFKTETLTVTASLDKNAASGWYQIGNGSKVNISGSAQFTVGNGMNYGETVTVNWGAKNAAGKEFTGRVSYKKVDPNAVITVYVNAPNGGNMYAWSGASKPCGAWPGKAISSLEQVTVNGMTFGAMTFADLESVNVIFNNNDAQTGDIEGITESTYFKYDGGSNYEKLDIDPTPVPTKPVVTASPASGTSFNETITVTLRVNPAVAIHYTTDGSTPTAASATYTQPLTFNATTTLKTYVENEIGSNVQTFTYTKTDIPVSTGYTIYFDNSQSNWSQVYAYVYGNDLNDFVGAWPGKQMSTDAESGYYKLFIDTDKDLSSSNVIFTNNSGAQTGDNVKIVNHGIYNGSGFTGKIFVSGINDAFAAAAAMKVWTSQGTLYIASPVATTIYIYRLDGTATPVNLEEGVNAIDYLPRGFYIVNRTKVAL